MKLSPLLLALGLSTVGTSAQTNPPSDLNDHLDLIKSRICDTMTSKAGIGATYIRLAFHDYVPDGPTGHRRLRWMRPIFRTAPRSDPL